MKRIGILVALAVGMAGSLSALDLDKVKALEGTLGPYMGETSQAALVPLEKTLAADLAKAPDDLTRVKLGIVYHNLSRVMAAQNVRGNAGKAADLFQAVVDGKGSEELKVFAHPYLGSAKALQGSEDLNPAMKILFVNQGMDRLGEAVSRYGQASYLPQFLRANVAGALPDFFGKADLAFQDLSALEAWAAKAPDRIPSDIRAAVANQLGDALKKKKQIPSALVAWKKALALDPQKKGPGKAAAASLEIYED